MISGTTTTRAPIAEPLANPTQRSRRRTRAKTIRRLLLAVVAVAAVVGLALAFRPRPVSVDLAVARRGPLVVAIEETGMTRVKDRYLVSASVAGSVPRLELEPGDPVNEGEVLVRIVPAASPLLDERSRAQAEAMLGAALSTLGQARANEVRASTARALSRQETERTRALVASGSLARQVLEEAEFLDRMRAEELVSATFAVKVANEEVRRARAALGRDAASSREGTCDVRSPSSGSVLRVHQKNAGVVQPGMPLLEIGDPTVLEVVVDLLTTDAVNVRPAAPVVIQGWGGDHALKGRVRKIEPSAFTRPSALGVDEQRVNVVVALTEPPERVSDLRDGYHVEVRFVLWQSNDVLEVPNGAVFRRGNEWAVYRVEASRARLTTVTIGHRGEGDVEIVSGLSAGDAVVVHPGDKVTEGARIEARRPR